MAIRFLSPTLVMRQPVTIRGHPHDFERRVAAGIAERVEVQVAYGHFGRDDIEFPWERTDKAEALKSAAGL